MTKKNRKILIAILVVLLASASVYLAYYSPTLPPKNPTDADISKTMPLMDTFVSIRAISSSMSETDIHNAIKDAFSYAGTLENMLSIYNPESELNKLNLEREINPSPDLLSVILAARRVNEFTLGFFDPTVVPVLKKHGFYKDMDDKILDNIPELDYGVGFNNVRIDDISGRVFLENNAWLDLSGIAKGYIVDRIAGSLRGSGIETFLVNAGGDIYCGKGPAGKNWRIGIREPGRENMIAVLDLELAAVATSGDYENVIIDEISGEPAAHIIDPKTFTVSGVLPSGFTVIAQECVTADAFATGMAVMGPKRSVELAENIDGVEVVAVKSSGRKSEIFISGGAEKYFSEKGNR
ncbi:MAG: FAD:protein FMN transferase [Candidatus Omnitrophota bacterium]